MTLSVGDCCRCRRPHDSGRVHLGYRACSYCGRLIAGREHLEYLEQLAKKREREADLAARSRVKGGLEP